MAFLSFDVKTIGLDKIGASITQKAKRAEKELAIIVAKDTEKFVPALTKSLVNRTQIVGNTIIYPGPYARYLYYGKVMVDAATGKGPAKYVNKYGDVVIRFKKGATLKPTAKDLNIKTSVHKDAQSHWFEASKAANLEKWEAYMRKVITDGLK